MIAGILVAGVRESDHARIEPDTGEHSGSYRTLLEVPGGELRGIARPLEPVHFGCTSKDQRSTSLTRTPIIARAQRAYRCIASSGASRICAQHPSRPSIAVSRNTRRSQRLRRCSLRTPSAVHRTTRRSSVRSSTACHPVSHHSVVAHPVLDRVHGGARVDLLRRSYAHSARPGHSCRCCRVARRCAAARCRYSV